MRWMYLNQTLDGVLGESIDRVKKDSVMSSHPYSASREAGMTVMMTVLTQGMNQHHEVLYTSSIRIQAGFNRHATARDDASAEEA